MIVLLLSFGSFVQADRLPHSKCRTSVLQIVRETKMHTHTQIAFNGQCILRNANIDTKRWPITNCQCKCVNRSYATANETEASISCVSQMLQNESNSIAVCLQRIVFTRAWYCGDFSFAVARENNSVLFFCSFQLGDCHFENWKWLIFDQASVNHSNSIRNQTLFFFFFFFLSFVIFLLFSVEIF